LINVDFTFPETLNDNINNTLELFPNPVNTLIPIPETVINIPPPFEFKRPRTPIDWPQLSPIPDILSPIPDIVTNNYKLKRFNLKAANNNTKIDAEAQTINPDDDQPIEPFPGIKGFPLPPPASTFWGKRFLKYKSVKHQALQYVNTSNIKLPPNPEPVAHCSKNPPPLLDTWLISTECKNEFLPRINKLIQERYFSIKPSLQFQKFYKSQGTQTGKILTPQPLCLNALHHTSALSWKEINEEIRKGQSSSSTEIFHKTNTPKGDEDENPDSQPMTIRAEDRTSTLEASPAHKPSTSKQPKKNNTTNTESLKNQKIKKARKISPPSSTPRFTKTIMSLAERRAKVKLHQTELKIKHTTQVIRHLEQQLMFN